MSDAGKSKTTIAEKTIRQAKALRARLEAEHGEAFAVIKEYAAKKNRKFMGEASKPLTESQDSSIPIDRDKNMSTVMKFMEARTANGKRDKFTKQVIDLMKTR